MGGISNALCVEQFPCLVKIYHRLDRHRYKILEDSCVLWQADSAVISSVFELLLSPINWM